jgi:hypothetical protein
MTAEEALAEGGGADPPRAVYGPYGSGPECVMAGNAKLASLAKAKSKWAGQVHFTCLPVAARADPASDS